MWMAPQRCTPSSFLACVNGGLWPPLCTPAVTAVWPGCHSPQVRSPVPWAVRKPGGDFSWRAVCLLAPCDSVKGYSGPLIKFNRALLCCALQKSAEVCCQSGCLMQQSAPLQWGEKQEPSGVGDSRGMWKWGSKAQLVLVLPCTSHQGWERSRAGSSTVSQVGSVLSLKGNRLMQAWRKFQTDRENLAGALNRAESFQITAYSGRH